METYVECAKLLGELLAGARAVRITVHGYMPLSVEEICSSEDGQRSDYLGIVQEVYRYDEAGKRTHVLPTLKQDLTEFAESWFANLKDQGFFARTAVREILSP